MVKSTSDAGYHATVRELPNEERPRERLERYGAASLTNPELLAIILRVGIQGENVIELRRACCASMAGWAGCSARISMCSGRARSGVREGDHS